MLFDNVDTLFQRKPEVTELFLIGWTRGIKVPRVATSTHHRRLVKSPAKPGTSPRPVDRDAGHFRSRNIYLYIGMKSCRIVGKCGE